MQFYSDTLGRLLHHQGGEDNSFEAKPLVIFLFDRPTGRFMVSRWKEQYPIKVTQLQQFKFTEPQSYPGNCSILKTETCLRVLAQPHSKLYFEQDSFFLDRTVVTVVELHLRAGTCIKIVFDNSTEAKEIILFTSAPTSYIQTYNLIKTLIVNLYITFANSSERRFIVPTFLQDLINASSN